MNYLDIIICIPLLWGLYKGFTKGFIVEAASIIALGFGIWGGIRFSSLCAEKLHVLLEWNSEYLPIVAFAIVFLSIVITIFFIAKLLSKIAKNLALGGIDKIAGAAVGFLKHGLILSIIIFIISAFEQSYPIFTFEAKGESLLYKPIGKIAPLLIPALGQFTHSSDEIKEK